MEEPQIVIDLVLAVLAAFVGGIIAQRFGQPVIVGYLMAGVAIGPFTPGPTADIESIRVLAEIGVAFLMFALGAEFSVRELRGLGRVAALGGALQVLFTMGLGPLLAPILGLTLLEGIFLGAILALSSTVVVLKLLMGRGEMQAIHGRVALGILIAQDLAVVPMVIVLPSLAGGQDGVLLELGAMLAKAAAVVAVAYLVGVRLAPWALSRAAIARTRELFLLGVVVIALGTALVTDFAGLSLAFGAFLAGLVVSESEYRTQVVAEALPLRDLFTSLFFVSVGMLIDPDILLSQAGKIALLVTAVVFGKSAIVGLVVLLLGLPARVAVLTALALAQVGEFSFVLANVGVNAGAIPPELMDLTLATALITIVLTPALLRSGPPMLAGLERLPVIGGRFKAPVQADADAAELRGHAVICGFGRLAHGLADALEARGIHYLVIEYNPLVVREVRPRGVPVIYGDAANPAVLEHAGLQRARLLAVLIPDSAAAEVATRRAREINPRLDIIARANTAGDIDRLRRAGATDVVQPEFEAGVEVVRHALRRYGVVGLELAHVAAGRRAAFYRGQADEDER